MIEKFQKKMMLKNPRLRKISLNSEHGYYSPSHIVYVTPDDVRDSNYSKQLGEHITVPESGLIAGHGRHINVI